MQFSELIDETSFIVSFQSSSVDQAFKGNATDPNKRIKQALNEAYRDEVKLGKINGGKRPFYLNKTTTWASGEETIEIPEPVRGTTIVGVLDYTNSIIGAPLEFYNPLIGGSGLYVVDYKTWGWYPTPSSDKSLYIIYLAAANKLEHDIDEPYLIYPELHDLLKWSAACLLWTVAKLEIPAEWKERRKELREQYWKMLSLGSPMTYPPPSITNYGVEEF